ncbi:hypothetical protein KIN20_009156 [Parelaphostrongylus tenuis]|uniref:Uncharacterized protein n=1 Tax=Parelaphostrongylus tenuis TaxID=148309 RepID=A0AAD5QJE0_PARTN|nr:hypothetical protein KIN20_009156 [Parelaphostrongylus tenuis]
MDEDLEKQSVHPLVLPPSDAYLPGERLRNLQRLREKNSFTDFQTDVYPKHLQDHVASQPIHKRILQVTLPHRERCIGCYRRMAMRVHTAYDRNEAKRLCARNSRCVRPACQSMYKNDDKTKKELIAWR